MKNITVVAAESQDDLDMLGPKFETSCETIKEAKEKAKYYLTEEYQNVIESSQRLGYSQVLVNGECRYDYFGKDVKS